MEIIQAFLNFLFDKSSKMTHKFVLIASIIVACIIVNYELGLSNYFFNKHKIEQVEAIEKLIQLKKSDAVSVKKLKALEQNILDENQFTTSCFNLFFSYKARTYSTFLFGVLNFWWILFIIGENIKHIFAKTFKSDVILSNFVIFSASALWARLLLLIPIFSSIIFNYILNFFLTLVFLQVSHLILDFYMESHEKKS